MRLYTVSFDVYDLRGNKIERSRREVYAETNLEAKNKIVRIYGARTVWGHVRVKNFKIEKFVPTEMASPTKPGILKFAVEYDLIFVVKDASGGWKTGPTNRLVRQVSHKKQIVEAADSESALHKIMDYWLRINPTSNIMRVHVKEVGAAKKIKKRKNKGGTK